MYNRRFQVIMSEHFNIYNADTREAIVGMVNESEKNNALLELTKKLYQHIIEKVADIDYGSIPNSKGDITKIYNYDKLIECIEVMVNIMKENNQDTTDNLDIISSALVNIKSRTDKFTFGYKINEPMIQMIYCNAVLAVVTSVSFMITSCIEYIKEPGSDSFQITVDKTGLNKTKNYALFQSLRKFNKSCESGEMDKVLDSLNKVNAKNMVGVVDTFAIMNATVIMAIVVSIVPLMRELIYFFYFSRVKMSDYLDIQADLLQMNIYNLENSNRKDKKDIVKKQKKIVDAFRKASNKIAIKHKEAQNKSEKSIADDKKHKFDMSAAGEIVNNANSSSSLF